MGELNLNVRAMRIADEIAARMHELGVTQQLVGKARVLDLGVKTRGSLDAGLLLARACLADLGAVDLVPGTVGTVPTPAVVVRVSHPVAACMASQYAGWQIKVGDYFAMGSGPMRVAYGKEELFTHIGFQQRPNVALGVLETGKLPPPEVIAHLSERCNIPPTALTLLCARTASLAGGVQIAARSVETALHKLHTLGFDLSRVVAGCGSAPLPPVARDDLAAIGRTNDAVLYGGQVTLYLSGDDDSLAQIGAKLPSSASPDYGKPFGELFKACGYDFYQIDPNLFSPAAVVLQNLDTGRSFVFGQINHDVLSRSFFNLSA